MKKIKKGTELTLRAITIIEGRTYPQGQKCIALSDQVNYDTLRVIMLGCKDSLGYDAVEYISKYSVIPPKVIPSEKVYLDINTLDTVLKSLDMLDK